MDFNESGRYWCCHEETVLAYCKNGTGGFVPIISQIIWELTHWVRNGRYFFGNAWVYMNGNCRVYKMHGIIDTMSNVTVTLVMPDCDFLVVTSDHIPPRNLRFDGRIMHSNGDPIFLMKTCESGYLQDVKMIQRRVLVEDKIPLIGLSFSDILVEPN